MNPIEKLLSPRPIRIPNTIDASKLVIFSDVSIYLFYLIYSKLVISIKRWDFFLYSGVFVYKPSNYFSKFMCLPTV